MRAPNPTFAVALLIAALGACSTDRVSAPNSGIAANRVTGGAAVDYAFLAGVAPIAGPDEAMASNGDVVALTGQGTFSVHSKTVTGSGAFTHKNAAGTVIGSGTWTATQLLSFNSYGSGSAQGLPAELEGGQAVIQVHLSPQSGGAGFDAVLQIDCLLGSPPPAAHEGIRLAVAGVVNFNKELEGQTVFIRQ